MRSFLASGLTATLREQSDVELVGAQAWVCGVAPRPGERRADVVVADYENGLALIASARARTSLRSAAGANVLIVTQRESEREIRHALEHGVRGYLILGCGVDEIVDAVRTLHRGVRYVGAVAARRLADSVACELLTARETDVLRLVVEGHGNKTIANRLDIAIGTVKTHLKAIFQKLEASSRTQVAAVAERRGLLAIPQDRAPRSLVLAPRVTPRLIRHARARGRALISARFISQEQGQASANLAPMAARAAHPNAGVKPMSSSTITTRDGTEIFYKDWGTGQPIVFHHGWPLSSDDWDAQMLFFLEQGYRVIAHDRRGHGRSTQTSTGNEMDTYAADVAALAAHLDLRNAIHVGHSTGGGEVARYVARHGAGRVAKAVLIGAVPPLMLKTAANPGGLPLEVFDGFREQLAANRAQFYREVPFGPFYGFNRPARRCPTGVIDNWWRQGMMGGAKAQYDCIKAFSETDFTEDLQSIDVPTLVLHGDDDQIVPIADSALLSSKLRQERHAEGLQGLPARHVHDPCRA